MLSRVMDSLYWIGRYSERTETNAHIVSVHIENMLEQNQNDSNYEKHWDLVIDICGYIDDYQLRYDDHYLNKMLHYLLMDDANFNSINALIESIRLNAKNTRDCIPNNLWEEWNSLYLKMQDNPIDEEYSILKTTAFLSDVRRTALTATGTIDSLMTRDESFQFIKIGKWIERSEKTALIMLRLIEMEDELSRDFSVTVGLQLTNAFDEYARRFRSRKPDDVLNFLIGDTRCSRSVSYGIRKIKKTILDIENETIRPYTEEIFDALEQLEFIVQKDASLMDIEERKQWIKEIHTLCMNFGPIFSKVYYLTPPILVK